MLEVEMKFRTSDWSGVVQRLNEWHAKVEPSREDTDHYFNASDRDFAQTDEAVRLRRIGSANFLTYKGPKIDRLTKTRKEVELSLADGAETAAQAVHFLTSLGYRPVAVVSKTRTVYTFSRNGHHIEVCLDDVGAVGQFVEIEIRADESQFESARSTLMATVEDLGLTQMERQSYLQMFLKQSSDGKS